jgi:hypothetical protein
MDCFNGIRRDHILRFHHITWFWSCPVVSAQLSHEFVCSSLSTCWRLNSKYCPTQRSFKFTVPSNTFTYVRYTEAGIMWGITGPYSALRWYWRFNSCVHLRSISICICNNMFFSMLSDVIHSFILLSILQQVHRLFHRVEPSVSSFSFHYTLSSLTHWCLNFLLNFSTPCI